MKSNRRPLSSYYISHQPGMDGKETFACCCGKSGASAAAKRAHTAAQETESVERFITDDSSGSQNVAVHLLPSIAIHPSSCLDVVVFFCFSLPLRRNL